MKPYDIFYDRDFRDKIRHSDEVALRQLMKNIGDDVQAKVVINSKDTVYFAMPDAATLGLSDLQDVQAAAKAGTVGSFGSVFTTSTFSTVCSTFTSLGSAGSLGTAATVK